MHYTLERILREDSLLLEHYQLASQRWEQILAHSKANDVEALARAISSEQFWFERNCGGRWEGQEVMVLAGFARLYSTTSGFSQNAAIAKILYEAFQRSSCSLELKAIAERTADAYDLV